MKTHKFSLSNYKLLTCDMGELVPIGLTEVLPGDTFQHSTNALIRVSPLLAPVMHPVKARIHHWFVPHRLVWEDWESFITGGEDGMDASVFPTISGVAPDFDEGTLADYLGLTNGAAALSVSALPFRGYGLIFNEWYRDQDLQSPGRTVDITSGADTTTDIDLAIVNWEKDYFTSARPWASKGPSIGVEVTPDGSAPSFRGPSGNELGLTTTNASAAISYTGNSNVTGQASFVNSGLELGDINELRTAFALQRYQEARARYGSRYTEYLRYLGVRSSDARLQRPEYLGGGQQTLQFSEVLQTGVTTDGDDTEGVGNLKGHGIGALRSNRYRRFFEEHGYVFTLLSVKPKTMYVQGMPRTWNRRSKEDFFQKELQHIGQQEILNKEIYAPHATPDGTFGYQDRYDEYRRQESTIAGEFRSSLNYWGYWRIFSSAPALNSAFVQANVTKRVNAVQNADVLWVCANHSLQARRQVSPGASSYVY